MALIFFNYNFIILVLVKNIYITICNISIFKKNFYPADILNILNN